MRENPHIFFGNSRERIGPHIFWEFPHAETPTYFSETQRTPEFGETRWEFGQPAIRGDLHIFFGNPEMPEIRAQFILLLSLADFSTTPLTNRSNSSSMRS